MLPEMWGVVSTPQCKEAEGPYLLCSLDEGVALTQYRRRDTTPAGPRGRGRLGEGNKRVLDKNDSERLLPRDYKYY